MIDSNGNYIHPSAIIGPNVTLGKNNYIGPLCIIGDFPEHREYWEEYGSVIIGDNNRFTKKVTIDSGTERDTIVFSNCTFLSGAHVGHDSIIHDNVTLSCNVLVGGHSVIYGGANIGLGAILHQRSVIQGFCMIGMGTIVTKKTITEPYCKYVGNPARYLGPNEVK